MTQGDVCDKIGADVAYLSNVESGKKNPTLETISRLAKVLGVKTEELLK